MNLHRDVIEATPSERRSERLNWLLLAVAFLLAVALVLFGLGWWSNRDAAHHAQSSADRANTAADRANRSAVANAQALRQANARLTSAGQPPVPTPAAPSSSPAPTATVTVTPQAKGPSDAQVRLAVAAYCSHVDCTPGPTPQQVVTAVARYCHANGECQGKPGTAGPGPTADQIASAVSTFCAGRNQCTGPAGQDATPDEIAAAVSAYCAANNGCQGDTGPQGVPGPTGPPVQSFTFTFTVPANGPLDHDHRYTATCTSPDYRCTVQED